MRFFQSPDGSWIGRGSNRLSVRPALSCPACYAPAERLEAQETVVDQIGLCQTQLLRCASCAARLEVFEDVGDGHAVDP